MNDLVPLKKSSHPLYLQVRDLVLHKILNKEWTLGEKIPTDRELSKTLAINHITLGKALNMLRGEGFLVRRPGHGTFVADMLPSINYASNVRKTIAVVFDNIDEKVFMTDLFISIFNALEANNLSLNLFSSKSSDKLQFEQLNSIINDPGIAGCIVWSIMDTKSTGVILKTKRIDFPLVFLDRYPNGYKADWSGHDDYSAGWLLGEAMKKLNFQHAVCMQLVCDAMLSTGKRRIAGFIDAFGPQVEKLSCHNTNGEYLKKELTKVADKYETRVAVAVMNDCFAVDVNTVIRNNKNLSSQFKLCYTKTLFAIDAINVQMGTREMGSNAVNILVQRLNGNRSEQLTLEAPCVLNKVD